jgi:glutamine synthetase
MSFTIKGASVLRAEYIWMDGRRPTATLRSKTKIIRGPVQDLQAVPRWGFDGSSTNQAEGHSSDCMLVPVRSIPDPVRGGDDILVLCEVMNADGTPHPTNTRAVLRNVAERHTAEQPLFGIEQEYTLYNRQGSWPYEWPAEGRPHPQGRYYCGVGCDEVFGRELIEHHTTACLRAGLSIEGTNAEVMPAQWEFQVGTLGPLEVADELWLARWLLYSIADPMGISVKLSPKPMGHLEDWNGAGAHVNFSTRSMREAGGLRQVEEACRALGRFHEAHIAVYGADNDQRLTGRHETSAIDEFRYGASDRGASIRIPMATLHAGCGYLEDRRPAANIDPYKVLVAVLETACGNGFEPPNHWVEQAIGPYRLPKR